MLPKPFMFNELHLMNMYLLAMEFFIHVDVNVEHIQFDEVTSSCISPLDLMYGKIL